MLEPSEKIDMEEYVVQSTGEKLSLFCGQI